MRSLRQELSTKVQNVYLEVLHEFPPLERQAALGKTRAEEQLEEVDGSKYAAGLLSSLDIMRAEISLAKMQRTTMRLRSGCPGYQQVVPSVNF